MTRTAAARTGADKMEADCAATAQAVAAALDALADPERAAHSARYFKTGPGQYAAGDRFLGVRVPEQRRIARRFWTAPIAEIDRLLASSLHECRLTGLLILVDRFERAADDSRRAALADFYLSRLERVDNWDLVDLSAPKILGVHLLAHPEQRGQLLAMSDSANLWERRIAVVATWTLIRQGQFQELLVLAERLLTDEQDLIHKAVGWMLREAGKVDEAVLAGFLNRHAAVMPRTMLRYAIERLDPERRRHFMAQKGRRPRAQQGVARTAPA